MKNLLFIIFSLFSFTSIAQVINVQDKQDTRKEKREVKKITKGKSIPDSARQFNYLVIYQYENSLPPSIMWNGSVNLIDNKKTAINKITTSRLFRTREDLLEFLKLSNRDFIYFNIDEPKEYSDIIAVYKMDWNSKNFLNFSFTDVEITKPEEVRIVNKEIKRNETIVELEK